MKTVALGGRIASGRVALVSDDQWRKVILYNWHAAKRGQKLYAATNVQLRSGRTTLLYMHRLIVPGVPELDHRDGNGLNNQDWNLRPATDTQNRANELPLRGRTSRFKGVYRHSVAPKWVAQITVDRHGRHLGLYADEELAARAYDAAALEAWGDFARLNFPEDVYVG